MILNHETAYWQEKDAIYTATEIYQEPRMWAKTTEIVKAKKEELEVFLDQIFKSDDYEVILTGAGTSEFVGNSVFPYLNTVLNYKVKSYGTTDLVADPKNYFHPKRHTLLVSFARSGNSPESVGAVDVANVLCENIYHLFITCNKNGALSKYGEDKSNCFVLNMPDETNDKSFAMTSSYSSMYLACIETFMQYQGLEFNKEVDTIIQKGQALLDNMASYLEELVNEFAYGRVAYLGANCLKGVSQELALKTCELTAGNIMTTYDSSMGFRHGPKSVVKSDSLSVICLSDDEYTRQYDLDIAKEIALDKTGKLLVVASEEIKEIKDLADYYLSFDNEYKMHNVYLGLEYALVGQLLGLYKSIMMNNTPDNPCSTGQVSRVVKGVTIYPYIK